MRSQRADGRGHWPSGRRRNDQAPPAGWPDVARFLRDVDDHCRAHHRTAALAAYLGVHRKTVYAWLTAAKWPTRETLLAMARWYRAERGSRR